MRKIEVVPNYWRTWTARLSIAIAVLASIVDLLGLFALQLGTFGAKLIAILSIIIGLLRAIKQHGGNASGPTDNFRGDRVSDPSGDRGTDPMGQESGPAGGEQRTPKSTGESQR